MSADIARHKDEVALARRILDDVGEAENAIGGLVGPQSDLRVSVPFTYAAGPLEDALPCFLTRFPDVRVLLTIDNRVVDLLGEDYDVAIRIGPLPDSELIARRILTLDLWPCASPGYLARHPPIAKPADLVNRTIIVTAQSRRSGRSARPRVRTARWRS